MRGKKGLVSDYNLYHSDFALRKDVMSLPTCRSIVIYHYIGARWFKELTLNAVKFGNYTLGHTICGPSGSLFLCPLLASTPFLHAFFKLKQMEEIMPFISTNNYKPLLHAAFLSAAVLLNLKQCEKQKDDFPIPEPITFSLSLK